MPHPLRLPRLSALLCGIFVMTLGACATAQPNNPPEGFTALFNGTDLAGWTGGTTRDPRQITAMSDAERMNHDNQMLAAIAQHWKVEAGELVSDGHEPHLVTTKDYGDFEFWVDWKLSANGDSGIYLRGCPQVQIWDPTNTAAHRHGSDKGSGGLWNNQTSGRFPSEVADRPIGEWNRMYIRMVGSYVTVKLNGKTVVDNVVLENFFDRDIPVFQSGPIHLQTHGSETRFRNIFIREIPADEANRMLAEMNQDEDNFESLFNGENLEGWIGATDKYEVVNGAIRCQAGHGGNLITQETYTDFVVRLQFKLPPGGNNGLAIRTPNAQVDPAHQAMELQVLDDTAEKYATLEPYQYHGSAYTIAAAHRGYLRPVGQWNYQEVRVVGDHVTVTLNGFKILDVHTLDAKPDHPFNSRAEGHFGFCGHNDPVEFRNILIKRVGAGE